MCQNVSKIYMKKKKWNVLECPNVPFLTEGEKHDLQGKIKNRIERCVGKR